MKNRNVEIGGFLQNVYCSFTMFERFCSNQLTANIMLWPFMFEIYARTHEHKQIV